VDEPQLNNNISHIRTAAAFTSLPFDKLRAGSAQGRLRSAQVLVTFLGCSKKVTRTLPLMQGAKRDY
jgi:hypothetical protein